MVVQPVKQPVTVEDFHRMGELGILGEDDRVELLDGQLVPMSPIGTRHSATVGRLVRAFTSQLTDRAIVWPQNPLSLGAHEVYPDLCLLRPRTDFYADRHPSPIDVYLVIEVADTSLRYDRDRKIPHYASAGVSEAWLVNLADDTLVIYREPGPSGYTDIHRAHRGDTIAPRHLPAVSLEVSAVLG